MLDLVTQYTLTEIIVFLIILAIAIKGFFTFWDWAVEKLRKVFNKETQQEQDKNLHEERYNELKDAIKAMKDFYTITQEQINTNIEQLKILIASDRDAIKAYITERHHYFCYEQKWIDDYSLDCLEKRYKHYVDEHGNSFVAHLMEELRALPTIPPTQK